VLPPPQKEGLPLVSQYTGKTTGFHPPKKWRSKTESKCLTLLPHHHLKGTGHRLSQARGAGAETGAGCPFVNVTDATETFKMAEELPKRLSFPQSSPEPTVNPKSTEQLLMATKPLLRR
jgi:hypothetical protein